MLHRILVLSTGIIFQISTLLGHHLSVSYAIDLHTYSDTSTIDTNRIMMPNGHKSSIEFLRLSQDEKQLLTVGGKDQRILLWDVEQAKVLKAMTEPSSITDIDFSSDGKYVLSKIRYGEPGVRLLDIENETLVNTFGVRGTKWGRFIQNGTQIMTGGTINPIKVWDAETGELLETFSEKTKDVTDPVFNSKRDRVLLKAGEQKLVLVDLRLGRISKHFNVPDGQITDYGLSVDNRLLVLAGSDKKIRLLNLGSNQLVGDFKIESPPSRSNDVRAMLSPDKNKLVAWSRNVANLWDVPSGQLLKTFDLTGSFHFGECKFTTDSKQLILSSSSSSLEEKGTLELWDVEHLTMTHSYQYDSRLLDQIVVETNGTFFLCKYFDKVVRWRINSTELAQEYKQSVTQPRVGAFDASGTMLALACRTQQENSARVIQLQNSESNVVFSTTGPRIENMTFSAAGDFLIGSPFLGNDLIIGNIKNASFVQTKTHESAIQTYSFNASEDLALTTCVRDPRAYLWDVSTGQLTHTFTEHSKDVNNAAFSPTGAYIVTTSQDGRAILWDAKTKKQVREFTALGESVKVPLFSSDEQYFFYSKAQENYAIQHLAQIDIETGEELRVYKMVGKDTEYSRWIPITSKEYLAIRNNQMIEIYNIRDGSLLSTIPIHSKKLLDLDFCPDQARIFVLEDDHTLYRYDIVSGELIDTIHDPESLPTSITFHPSGSFFIASNWDDSLTFWESESVEKLMTYIALEDNTWFVIDASGKFDYNNSSALEALYFAIPSPPLGEMDKERREVGLLQKTLAPLLGN